MKYFTSYLAGVIDSDGSISIIKRTKQTTTRGYSYRELVQLSWVYSTPALKFMNEIKKLYGGSVFEYTKQANEFSSDSIILKYTVEAKGADKLVRDILPYLTLKKEQAKRMVKMRELKSMQYGAGNPKPDSHWKLEDAIWKKNLKQKSRAW
ncbi:MAG TPA: hypothetical protein ENI23_15900 [bacterium]|nr:hypothetical protein [bacterium]